MVTRLYLVKVTNQMTDDMLQEHGLPMEKIAVEEKSEKDYLDHHKDRIFEKVPKVKLGESEEKQVKEIKEKIPRPLPVSQELVETIKSCFSKTNNQKEEVISFLENHKGEKVFISSHPDRRDQTTTL